LISKPASKSHLFYNIRRSNWFLRSCPSKVRGLKCAFAVVQYKGHSLEFVQNNLMWVGVAIGSGALLLWSLITERGGAGVSPMQATLLINREDAVIVDVRETAEFEQSHLPNARHIPLGQLKERMAELEKFKERAIVVYCAVGNRSASAATMLSKEGFTKVSSLAGGIGAWQQASLPTTKK